MRSNASSTPLTVRKASKAQRPAADGLNFFTVPKLKADTAPALTVSSIQHVHSDLASRHAGKENKLPRPVKAAPAVQIKDAMLHLPQDKLAGGMLHQAVAGLQCQQAMSDRPLSAPADVPITRGQHNVSKRNMQLASSISAAPVPAPTAMTGVTASGRPYRGNDMPVNSSTCQPGMLASDVLEEDFPLACQTAITKRRSDILSMTPLHICCLGRRP